MMCFFMTNYILGNDDFIVPYLSSFKLYNRILFIMRSNKWTDVASYCPISSVSPRSWIRSHGGSPEVRLSSAS